MRNTYCTNCRIELSYTETVCPLCGERIASESDDTYGAYPSNVEKVPLSRRHTALKGLIVLLFPALCCFIIDMAVDGHISWGPYIWGAEACFFTIAFLPKLFKKPKASICILADTAVLAAYLFVIGLESGSTEWVLPLGLPLAALTGLLVFLLLKTIQMKKPSQMFKSAAVICTLGVFVLAIQVVIGMFEHGTIAIGWALPVVLPTLFISVVLFYIEYNRALKDRLMRAVFL